MEAGLVYAYGDSGNYAFMEIMAAAISGIIRSNLGRSFM